MASRVNTKLIVILTSTAVAAVGIVVAISLYSKRMDPKRNIRMGDEAMQRGDYRAALDAYGRAVNKNPGSEDFLNKFEDAELHIVPSTQDEASDLYQQWRRIMINAIQHTPGDARRHLRLIRETMKAARLSGQSSLWEEVVKFSNDMWSQVPESDGDRVEAKLYRALATWHMSSRVVPDELTAADQDIEDYVAAKPESDLGWATKIFAEIQRGDQMQLDTPEATTLIQKQRDRVDQTIVQAVKAVPTGAETAYMVSLRTIQKRMMAPNQVSMEDVGRAISNAMNFATATEDEALIQDVVYMVTTLGGMKNLEGGAEMLKTYLAKYPDKIDKQYNLARVLYIMQKWEDSMKEVEEILAKPQLAVSYQAVAQFDVRKMAAGLAGDIEFQRFSEASGSDQPTDVHLANMEKARERLVKYESDTSKLLVVRADAYISYAKRDYRTAAKKFEQLINMPGGAEFDSIINDAVCLEMSGEVGQAYQRIMVAVKSQPRNSKLLIQEARLEAKMNRYEDARETFKKIDESQLDENDKKLLASIQQTIDSDSPEKRTPVMVLINEAQEKSKAKDYEGADAKLAEAEGLAENKAGVAQLRAVNALMSGNKDRAIEFIDKALAIEPNNVNFLRFKTSLVNEDPVDRTMEATKGMGLGEADLAVRRVLELGVLTQHLEAADSNPPSSQSSADTQKIHTYLEHARKELDTQLDLAMKLKPDSPQVYEYRFNRALAKKDWKTVEGLLGKIKELNIDGADGLLFQGRYERVSGKAAQSIRTLEQAIERVGFMSAAWRELGQSYQAVGNFGQALSAYSQAYDRNPNDLPVVKEYLGLLIGQGDQAAALKILSTAQRLAPQDTNLREQWLQLEYRFRDKGLAMRKRRELWKTTPEDTQNATQLAFMLVSTEPARELVTDDQGSAKIDAGRWDRMTQDDRTKFLQDARNAWNKEADDIVAEMAKGKTDPYDLMVVRSRMKLMRGDDRGGEAVIQDFIKSQDPSNITSAMWITLGRYQQEVRLMAAAENSFRTAEKLQDKDSRDAQRALAALYFANGHYAEAEPELEEVLEVDDSAAVQQQLIECMMREQKFDEARARLTKLHDSGQASVVSTLLEAGIANNIALKVLTEGRSDVANQEFSKRDAALSRAEQLDPTSPVPHLYRAQEMITQYEQTKDPSNLSDAMQSVDHAEQIRSDQTDVTYTRVRILRLKNDFSGALAELQRLVTEHPDDSEARKQLINMLLDMNRVDASVQAVNEAINKYPSSPTWLELLGDIYKLRKNDQVQAANAYQRANSLVPSATLMTKMTESLLGTPAPDYRNLRKLIEEHPEFMDGVPYLRVLYVRTLAGAKQSDAALAQLRVTYAQYKKFIEESKLLPTDIDRFGEALTAYFGISKPEDIEAFMNDVSGGNMSPYEIRMLAVLWFATKGTDGMNKAVEMEKQAIAKCKPDDVEGKIKLMLEAAVFLLQLQRYEESAQMYEEALKIDPRLPDALNNLAFILAENLKQPSKAISYTDRALQVRPDDPSFLDTAGWVYYRAGNLDKGREYLERSLEKEETVSTAINLTHVLIDMNKYEDALDAAERAERILNAKAKGAPDPQMLKDIQALKDDIHKKQAGG